MPNDYPAGEMRTDPMIGSVIANRYEILSLVGKGGMSQVYKARNKSVGSIVAIKTLKQDLLADEELFARFCREAKAVQTLTHPNIVTMHEFGITLDGQPFMAMDYLEGQTLEMIIEKSERIGVKRICRIFAQVCDALAHAHAHQILHRDIKPGNIMVIDTANDTDVVKIFDFGFAKMLEKPGRKMQALTQLGDVLGTPLYMSPEQSAGKSLDSRSDIYGIGCVMYEALTGRAPLIGDNVQETMQKQIHEKPAALDTARPDLFIPEQMQAILSKTLEKNPDDRYQSMLDLGRDLEIVMHGMSGRAGAAQPRSQDLPGLSRGRKLPEEKKISVLGIVSLVLIVLGGVAVTCYAGFTMIAGQGRSDGVQIAPARIPDSMNTSTAATQTGATPVEAPHTVPWKPPKMTGNASKDISALLGYAEAAEAGGQHKAADTACTQAIDKLRKSGHTNDIAAARAFALSGAIKLSESDWRKADVVLQKALAIQQRELGLSAPTVITTLRDLGRAAEGEQDFARADAYYKQAMALKK